MNSLKLSLQGTTSNFWNASHLAPTFASVISETPTMHVEIHSGVLPKSLTICDISQTVSSCMSGKKNGVKSNNA